MVYYFDFYKEFIDKDLRSKRDNWKVTSETLTRRCQVMLPPELVKGKTILDLGSGLGAMGHWCLQHGATHYTGVEIQKEFREISNELLSKYHSNFTICDDMNKLTEQYDIVIAAGFMHGFLNVISAIEKVCSLSNEYIIIESLIYHYKEQKTPNTMLIGVVPHLQMVNAKHEQGAAHSSGFTVLPTETAYDFFMEAYGFIIDKDNIIPDIKEIDNLYGIKRFIKRFKIGKNESFPILENEIKKNALEI
jgi:predicted TPR repeat methyltransferase